MEKEFSICLSNDIIKKHFHYPVISYKVELYGCWNNWTLGKPAHIEHEMSRSQQGRWTRPLKYHTFIKLNAGTYEYKWKFTYKDAPHRTHVIWLNDETKKITNSNSWNQNNIFHML